MLLKGRRCVRNRLTPFNFPGNPFNNRVWHQGVGAGGCCSRRSGQNLVIGAGIGPAKLFADLGHFDPHAQGDQHAQALSHGFEVFGFRAHDLQARIALLRAELDIHPDPDQIAVQDRGQSFGIGPFDIFLNLPVFFARPQPAGHGIGGRGLAQHRLADLLIQPVGAFEIQIRRSPDIRSLNKIDCHAFGDDRGTIARDIGHGCEQGVAVLLGRPGPVFSHPQRLAIGLGEDRPVPLGIGFEHPAPGGNPGQTAAQGQAGLRLDIGIDELATLQRLFDAVCVQHLRGGQVVAVEPEPARIAALQPLGEIGRAVEIPPDLGKAVAFAQAVEDVEHLVGQLVALQPVADQVCLFDILGVVTGRLHRDLDLADRTFAGGQHRQIMRVALFNGFGQLEVAQRIALIRRTQDRRQPDRGQPIGGIARDRRADAANAGGRHFGGQRGPLDRAAKGIKDLRFAAHYAASSCFDHGSSQSPSSTSVQ